MTNPDRTEASGGGADLVVPSASATPPATTAPALTTYALRNDLPGTRPARAGIDFRAALNEAQHRAVIAGDGPLLIIAGAGTGKTRTLIYRVARLVLSGVAPESILLLSFTRKAAEEMLRRALSLGAHGVERVQGGTFHSFANHVLRQFGSKLGLSPSFTILDEGDSEDLIGLLRSEGGHATKDKRFPRKQTIRRMFSRSINCVTPLTQVLERDHPHFAQFARPLVQLFEQYERYKLAHHMADYDDLLLLLKALLSREPEVRKTLSERYRHILVDEYQDTNRIQADIVRLLADTHQNVTVVGDDAQSIYSFRGAEVRNILEFAERFPGATTVTLEENYRSVQPILDFTNALIAASPIALTKRLKSHRRGGVGAQLVRAMDEYEQSRFVVQRVLELREEGIPLDKIAVLFRSSYQAFDLELALGEAGIPFVKRGGFKLMETAHVRDVVAHLRVIRNPTDRVAWLRLLLLVEGIGPARAKTVIERVAATGDAVAAIAEAAQGRYGRAAAGLEALAELMLTLGRGTLTPSEAIAKVVEYYVPLLQARHDDHPKRLRDLEHLVAIAERFRSVDDFLADLALEPPSQSVAGATPRDADDELLVLSTIHSAKGLEWHTVFVIWALDGRFPSFLSLNDPAQLEEERRLLYVAATRARDLLYITYPMNVPDRASGRILTEPSRFLGDVPAQLFTHVALVESPAPPRAALPRTVPEPDDSAPF
ncbi:MAG: ATP-dependent helicase [bacterium]